MHLRPANMRDADLLYRWRNDPETRAQSVDTNLISYIGHRKWLRGRIEKNLPTYIAEFHGHPVGTCHIDEDVLSYSIGPEYRGHGYGRLMLALIKDRHGPLRCLIKAGNQKSIHVAKASGHLVALL